MEVAGHEAITRKRADIRGGAITSGGSGLVVPAVDMGGNLVVDALAEFLEFPGDGREGVVTVRERAGNITEAEKAAEGSFSEAAGIGIGLIQLPTNFSRGDTDRELLHVEK